MMTQLIGAAELRRMSGLFTTIEVAKQLGIKKATFYDHVYSGRLPRPTTTIGQGRRRYYTMNEVNELKKRIKAPE